MLKQYDHGMLDDGQRVRRRLLGRWQFPSYLQKDLGFPPPGRLPIMAAEHDVFLSEGLCGLRSQTAWPPGTLIITPDEITIAQLYRMTTDIR